MVIRINLLKIWYFFATGFGLGNIVCWIPVGTLASFMAVPIWWLLVYCFSYQFYYIFLFIGIILGIYFCHKTDKLIGVHDHRSIVFDEFIGMWITLSVISIYSWIWIVISFCVFRVLDIIKPYPISWFDSKISGGLGVVIDDVLAGIFSIGIILSLMRLFTYFDI